MAKQNHGDFRRSRPGRTQELRGDDLYYGGARSQREDWARRAFDNNEGDRRERMYRAGGGDFDEEMRDYYESEPRSRGGERSWWADHSPISGDHPWYEGQPELRNARRSGFAQGVRDFFGVGPKGYRRSDERIREEVCEALARHPGVDASDIEVSVLNGHVTLAGTVENRWMKRQAQDAVEYVPGVEDTRIELTIAASSSGGDEGGRPRQVS